MRYERLGGRSAGQRGGTFQTVATFASAGYQANSVAVEDVDGDGKPDIILANVSLNSQGGDGTVGVLINTSTPDFQLSANPASVNVSAPGQSGTTTLTITPADGFNQTVSFTCSNLPSEASCSFANTSGGATMTINTAAPSARLQTVPLARGKAFFYALLFPGSVLFPGFLGLAFTSTRKRTLRGMRLLSLLCAVGFCSLCFACGGSSTPANTGTPTGTVNLTVTATAGSLSHQVVITLNVQ